MAIKRQQNWLGSQRVDAPHLRALESAVSNDFDLLAGDIMAGGDPLVISGFDLISAGIGDAATGLQVHVASAIIMHPQASEAGTIFSVPETQAAENLNTANTKVSGGFTSDQVNYVGVGIKRTSDSTTADLVQFLDIDSGLEKPKLVPLGRTLNYYFVISTQDFSSLPGIASLAKITTDTNNNITIIEDARSFMFRLGSGGTLPDPQSSFLWAGGRAEIGDNSEFNAGDKAITSLKSWMDASMSRLWEVGGGERWYSPTADRNVKMLRGGSTFDNGDRFEWDGTYLHWQGLTFIFDNSTAYFNDVADHTDDDELATIGDGQCIYVDIDRSTNRTGGDALQGVKADLVTLSAPTIPGSRYIIAWRYGSDIYTRESTYPVNGTFIPATDSSLGLVQLEFAAGDPDFPIVMAQDANGGMQNIATNNESYGLKGTGGTTNGVGVEGQGTGAGSGVKGTGGTTSLAAGVYGIGGSTNGRGGIFEGVGTGNGVYAVGGSSNGIGVTGVGGSTNGGGVVGTGTGSGAGVAGTGGATSGAIGVSGTGGSTNGVGVAGTGIGSGPGVRATCDTGRIAVDAIGTIDMVEESVTPATPASNKARLFLQDDGSGKTQLAIVFSDGTVTVIASMV